MEADRTMKSSNLLSELDDLNNQKVSKSSEKKYEKLLKELLISDDGAVEVLERLHPEIKLPRPALRGLVKVIDELFMVSGQEDKDLYELLEPVIKRDKINSDARWKALSLYLRHDFSQGLKLFKEAISEYSDRNLPEVYEKYIRENIEPDGGLPYLLRLLESDSSYLRLIPTVVLVVDYLEGNTTILDETTVLMIESCLKTIFYKTKAFDIRLLGLVRIAAKNIANKNSIKDTLLQVYPSIVERMKNGAEQKHHDALKEIANTMGLTYDKELSQPTSIFKDIKLARDINVSDENLLPKQGPESKEKQVDVVARAQTLSERFIKLKNQFNAFSADLGHIQKQIFEYESMRTEYAELLIKVKRFEAENNDLCKEKERLASETQRVSREMNEIKQRCSQDVALAQKKAEYELDTFRHRLWGELQAYLLEAMEDAYPVDNLTINERIYLEKLRKIVQILREHKVIMS
jgi:hypothetical protein